MPETEKLTSVPSVPCLGAGQVGQSAPKADHPRDNGGTVDLKALAFKVLQKANAGHAWDSSGTEVSQTHVPRNRPVGQLQGLNGTSWTAEAWAAFFHERAGIREYDSRQSRQEAERQALAETVEHWRALHPVPPSGPEIGCVHCGKGAGDQTLVPHLAGSKDAFWLHTTCWPVFDHARRLETRAALKKMIPALHVPLKELLDEPGEPE
jgi:hypothetical protein